MNKRIKEFIKQCTSIEQVRDGKTPIGPKFETFDEEKFAELIVKECAEIADEAFVKQMGHMKPGPFVKRHFGVER